RSRRRPPSAGYPADRGRTTAASHRRGYASVPSCRSRSGRRSAACPSSLLPGRLSERLFGATISLKCNPMRLYLAIELCLVAPYRLAEGIAPTPPLQRGTCGKSLFQIDARGGEGE